MVAASETVTIIRPNGVGIRPNRERSGTGKSRVAVVIDSEDDGNEQRHGRENQERWHVWMVEDPEEARGIQRQPDRTVDRYQEQHGQLDLATFSDHPASLADPYMWFEPFEP